MAKLTEARGLHENWFFKGLSDCLYFIKGSIIVFFFSIEVELIIKLFYKVFLI